jgi:hypothetical protein
LAYWQVSPATSLLWYATLLCGNIQHTIHRKEVLQGQYIQVN